MFRLRSLLLQSLILLAAPAFAATLNVGPGQPYTTIQSAIAAANNGDTVLVYPGTYYENIDFKGKAITVTSTSGPSGGAANTIIDGGSTAPAVSFVTAETRSSVLTGFTIQHGGVFNYAIYSNGGIYLSASSPSILNNVLTRNNCWTIKSLQSAPLIQGNEISATQDNGDCSFGGGAGIYISGNLNGSTVTNNGTSAMIIGNTIENNVQSGADDAGGNGGAAIAIWGGSPVVINNTLRNNASPGGSGGAINVEGGAGVAIVQNLIYNNSAGCGGGALALQGYVDPRTGISVLVANNTIVNNTSTANAGFSNCIATSQIYPSPASYGSSNPTTVLLNNIISGSTSYPAVNCSWFNGPSETLQPTFQNDILYNAGGVFFGPRCIDVSSKYNNIPADPQLLNPSAGDLHLTATSPAIDAGQNSVLQTYQNLTGLSLCTDFDGNPRIQGPAGASPSSALIDMGAYEHPGVVTGNCSNITETLTSSLNPSIVGQTVTFTAQLTSSLGIPTGDVQFSDGSNVLSTQTISSTGTSTFSTNSLTVGSHTITAAYQPTGVFSPTTSSLIQQVNGYTTTTTLTSSLNPSLATQSVIFTATVASSSGTPTGSVQFFDGSTLLATQTLTSAIATYSTSALAPGTHNMQAVYVPSGSFAASTGSLTQVVTGIATTTNLSCNPNPLYITQSPVLFATVTSTNGIPTGSVTFTDNGVAILPTPPFTAGATATESNYQFTSPGTHTIVATYVPSGNFAASSASCSVVVNLDPTTTALTSSLDPSVFSQPVTFTATVTFGPPVVNFAGYGTVTFSDGAAILQTVTINSTSVSGVGTAIYTTGTLAQGTHNITATLNPNSAPFLEYASSSASLTQVVNNVPTTISLSAAPNPAPQGQTVTITAKVVSSTGAAPPGTVSFLDAGAVIGVSPVNSSGVATLPTSTLALGNHLLVAVYVPDPTSSFLASSSNDFTETIEANAFTIALSPSTLTLTAGMSGSTTVQLASGGLFSGPLTLSFGTLPQYATGTLSTSAVTLTAGGNASSTFSLQTSMIGANSIPPRPGSRAETVTLYALLLVLPLAFRRRRLRNLFVLCAAAFLLQTLTACTTIRTPLHLVPTGTYQIPFTATDAGSNSRTQSLTLIIQ